MLSDLAWLQAPPKDLRAQFKKLEAFGKEPSENPYNLLMRLAATRLNDSQLTKLAAIAQKLSREVHQLTRVKLGLIGDGTLSLLGGPIAGSGIRHGLLIDVVEGAYGQAVMETADRDSNLHLARLDLALLTLDYRIAGLDRAASDGATADEAIDSAFNRIRMICEAMRPGLKGPMLVQTLVPPVEPLYGSFDRIEQSSVFSMIEALNRRLAEWARTGEIVLVDIARLAATIGYERWDDPRHWHASKLSFSPEFTPAYADVVARTIGSIMGKSKKALVLDLDNTLWGGIIGDDGLEGIKLGQGSATGEAHVAIQRMALELRSRGIVLAVCSKNEDAAARLPFQQHAEMLLKENHIAVFQANWSDKASNLRAIAQALNIGVDALVFLDDNPAEREQVRAELPMVGVPEVPADPAQYPRLLAAAGYFEAVTISDEDRSRASLYQTNAERAKLLDAASDVEGYLRSLDMTCTIQFVTGVSRGRVAQLVNKSNQFNLTTRRYTEPEIEVAAADPRRHVVQVRLVDRFGDNGIISVVIADKHGAEWDIDTWLMSCRVLGRRVQEAVLEHLVRAARSEGALRLTGRYIASAKNAMVADHYAKLGFVAGPSASEGETHWSLDIAEYTYRELPMRVIDDAVANGDQVA